MIVESGFEFSVSMYLKNLKAIKPQQRILSPTLLGIRTRTVLSFCQFDGHFTLHLQDQTWSITQHGTDNVLSSGTSICGLVCLADCQTTFGTIPLDLPLCYISHFSLLCGICLCSTALYLEDSSNYQKRRACKALLEKKNSHNGWTVLCTNWCHCCKVHCWFFFC